MRTSLWLVATTCLAACSGLQAFSPYVKDGASSSDTDVQGSGGAGGGGSGGGGGGAGGGDTDVSGGSETGWPDSGAVDSDVAGGGGGSGGGGGGSGGGGGGGGGGALTVTLGFWQDFDYFLDYQSKGHHEVWIGPESSTDPKDGTWVLVVTDAELQASSFGNGWERQVFDISAKVGATGWTRFRVAFRYDASNADNWYVDDVCLGSVANPTVVGDCDLGYQNFETASYPRLPNGWTTIRGANQQGIYHWESTSWSHGGFQGSNIHFSIDNIDQFMVSAAMDVRP